jgi:hypothetical protein
MRYLTVGAMFKDEAPYLAEWVSHHLAQGVDHIFLYNNGSTDDPERVLQPFLDQGSVSLITWPAPKELGSQIGAAHDLRDRTRGSSRWAAFIDVDEFLFSPAGSLPSVLRVFEDEVGIEVNWVNYGSSKLEVAGHGEVRDRFLYRAPLQWKRNRQFKSIFNPLEAESRVPQSHAWKYRNGRLAVNEVRRPLNADVSILDLAEWWLRTLAPSIHRTLAHRFPLHFNLYGPRIMRRVSVDLLRINHYPLKSRQEYSAKQVRHGGKAKYSKEFFAYHDRNEVFDPILSARDVKISPEAS